MRLLRRAAGIALLLHGLAHAVLPLRGAGRVETTALGQAAMLFATAIAMTAFVAASFGLLGVRTFLRRANARTLTRGGAVFSMLSLVGLGSKDLHWGLLIDAAFLVLTLPKFGVFHEPVFEVGGEERDGLFRRAARVGASALAVVFSVWILVSVGTKPMRDRWGVRDDELTRPLPGDWENRRAPYECTHAITIDAPPEAVWPWLIQIGQDRGGFYSYESLENLLGLHIRNADRVHPEWQTREPGDLVRAAPPNWLGGRLGNDLGWKVTLVETNRALVLHHWGAFVLEPEDGGRRTRLIVRSKMADPSYPVWAAVPGFLVLDMPHFIMERKMLLTIRERVEASARPVPATPPRTPPTIDAHDESRRAVTSLADMESR